MNGSAVYYETIDYVVRDPVATITLRRPERRNAWTPQMSREIDDAVARSVGDPAVVGIVLTGAGSAFCAGADMTLLEDGSLPTTASWREGGGLGRFSHFLEEPKPIIAAINGPVVGMAVAMVLACDLRYMATEAGLAANFTRRGLDAEFGSAWLLSRLIGTGRAAELLLSGRWVDAEEAERIGLVNRVMAADALMDSARTWVADVAAWCSPTAVAAVKSQLVADAQRGLRDAEAASLRNAAALRRYSDVAEGARAFRERRAPRFQRLPASGADGGADA